VIWWKVYCLWGMALGAWLGFVRDCPPMPYGPYPEGDFGDTADLRGKQVKARADEGPSSERAPGAAVRKRKLGMADDETGLKATGRFIEELMETCAVPGECLRPSSGKPLLEC
jgi:hypothetical protein